VGAGVWCVCLLPYTKGQCPYVCITGAQASMDLWRFYTARPFDIARSRSLTARRYLTQLHATLQFFAQDRCSLSTFYCIDIQVLYCIIYISIVLHSLIVFAFRDMISFFKLNLLLIHIILREITIILFNLWKNWIID
jgi:hypothetical protein